MNSFPHSHPYYFVNKISYTLPKNDFIRRIFNVYIKVYSW